MAQVRGEGAPGAAADPRPHTPLVLAGSTLKRTRAILWFLSVSRRDFLLRKMELPQLKVFILFSLLTTQYGEESVTNFANTAHTLILLLLLPYEDQSGAILIS